MSPSVDCFLRISLPLFSLTYSPRNISFTFLSPSKQKRKKKLEENAKLSLRRFKSSFSFFTSETLDRSSLGEGQSEGQKKTKKANGGETERIRQNLLQRGSRRERQRHGGAHNDGIPLPSSPPPESPPHTCALGKDGPSVGGAASQDRRDQTWGE